MTLDVPFDSDLRDRLHRHLASHEVRTHAADGRRRAAVSVVVIDSGSVDGTAGGASFLLTRRGSRLNAHPGQWALPGGRIDDGETAIEAALREMDEEIGLTLDADALLGRLDDFPTRSGYVITPFVFWAGDDVEPVANPDEVASIHRVAIRELVRDDSPRFVSIPESDRPVIQVPIGGDLIHAPTGAVLYQFRAVAFEGTSVRVDEYEQPVFAWK